MEVTAREIARRLNGETVGDPDVKVTSAARIEYGKPGDICFFANPKYERYVYCSKASAILVNRSFEPAQPISATLIKVDDAYQAVAELLSWFQSLKKNRRKRGFMSRIFGRHRIGRRTRIGKGTWLGDYVTIGAGCTIGRGCTIYPNVSIADNVTIGDDTVLYSGARVYSDCIIGSRCILHSNCVIGSDGFGFAPQDDGSYKKIPQTGNVVIEDDVEIGACTTVDRATMGSTILRTGVKLDNLCQIAHNVEVGAHTVMAAESGAAGSAKIGKYCTFGGKTMVVGHISVADHTTLAADSVITKTIRKSGQTLMGYPAMDADLYKKALIKFRQSGQEE
ncbi:MAG: UDP-3-O-(3-hydroxymyristoyl)glucosamine N-acyltransferase [Bacteroidales bacterium]|nr:UDP-3-O-(3-hydroxymyristoyl)glucosamine N-acyltransferase [Bacteroidales bacterium]